MKVYIFGAGASNDSQDPAINAAQKSPVTNQLFDRIYRTRFAQPVGLHIDEVESFVEEIKLHDNSLEDWLTNWWNETEASTDPYRKGSDQTTIASISFYIWWLFQNVSISYNTNNLYREFCKKIKGTDFSLISFNYDTLLDKAVMEVFKKDLSGNLQNYIDARLVKPHGSVNWFLNKREADAPFSEQSLSGDTTARFRIASTQMFKNGPFDLTQITIKDPFLAEIQNIDLIRHGIFNYQYFFPMVFLPLTTKQNNFVSSFYEKIIASAKEMLASASDIYVLGYRARDKVVSDIFSAVNQETKIHVVGKGNAESTQGMLMQQFPNLAKGQISNDGFANFVKSFSP